MPPALLARSQFLLCFFKICPCVRASVQKPIALESVDFASPKMVGSKKRDSVIVTFCLTISRFCAAKRGWGKKAATSCQSVFVFCEIHSSHIFPAVSPHQRANKYFCTSLSSKMAREEQSITLAHFAQRPIFSMDPHFGRCGFRTQNHSVFGWFH